MRRNISDEVADELRASIFLNLDKYLTNGGRLSSEQDLAREFGVSRVSVRAATEILKHQGILISKQGSGTLLAHPLPCRGNATRAVSAPDRPGKPRELLGIIAPINEPFFYQFYQALEIAAYKNGFLPLLTHYASEIDAQVPRSESIANLLRHGIQNFLVWPIRGLEAFGGTTFGFLDRLRGVGANIVKFDDCVHSPSADSVGIDDAAAVTDLVKRIREQSCKILYMIGWIPSEVPISTTEKRTQVFLTMVGDRRSVLPVSRRPQIDTEVAQHLIGLREQGNFPDAIICMNGEIGRAVTRIASRTEWWPQTVIGVIDQIEPVPGLRVICIAQPFAKMADHVMQCFRDQSEEGVRWRAREFPYKGDLLDFS